MKPKPFKLIYLDVDGVLANYVEGILRLSGEKAVQHDDIKDYDMHRFINATQAWVEEARDMWGGAFWENLPAYSNAKRIVDEARRLSDHVCFLTTPSSAIESRHGKLRWLEHNIGTGLDVCFAQLGKHHYAGCPRTLLIDDNARTVREFGLAGSASVRQPRPWNASVDPANTVPDVLSLTQRTECEQLLYLLSTNHPLPNAH